MCSGNFLEMLMEQCICVMLFCLAVLYHAFEKSGERNNQSFGRNTVEFLVTVHLHIRCITDRKFPALSKTGVS
jgi:hypothetical protein